jgi:hypothetical protein
VGTCARVQGCACYLHSKGCGAPSGTSDTPTQCLAFVAGCANRFLRSHVFRTALRVAPWRTRRLHSASLVVMFVSIACLSGGGVHNNGIRLWEV